MPLYIFYPRKSDACSLGFEAVELLNDTEANTHALQVLEEHITASFVAVWCGDRKVLTRPRIAAELSDVLVRPPTPDVSSQA